MAVNCPTCGRTDVTETLADRFRCLKDGTYFTFNGEAIAGGLQWTSTVPQGAVDDADITVTAFENQ